jgi:RNA polymerase sigma-70 factor (ECF subfamily)
VFLTDAFLCRNRADCHILLPSNAPFFPNALGVDFQLSREYQVMSDRVADGSSTLLLMRLSGCPTDGKAWDQLVQRYGRTIYNWCRRHQLQDADARDITQNVFAGLLQRLRQFDRSRARFRTWLYQLVENSVRDWCANRQQRHEKGTAAVWQALASVEAQRDLESRLNEEYDLELLELAEMRVRLRVQPQSWDAYRLFCKEQLSLKEAAKALDIPAGHISKYAGRVRDLIASEITLHEKQETGSRELRVGAAL